MRKELRNIGKEERHKFTAIFERTGWKSGYKGDLPTVLLLDVRMDNNLYATIFGSTSRKGSRTRVSSKVTR